MTVTEDSAGVADDVPAGQGFTFVDLFAGIGGFHRAFGSLGGRCVLACDINKYSRQTYTANYGIEPFGDITTIGKNELPDHDVLCGGFPCQPFSLAGVSKKNSMGVPHGFQDPKQGNMFFEIIRLVNLRRPKMMFLENVKNLKSHDRGNTWRVIRNTLVENNYNVFLKVVDAKHYVPQHRERMFIICLDANIYPGEQFVFPDYPHKRAVELAAILDPNPDPKYVLSDNMWAYLQKHKENSRAKGSGFGFGLVDPATTEYTRTMSARYYKDGSEILIRRNEGNPRRLTPREAARLFGYPESFTIPVSDAQAYRQFGNSVVVPAVQSVAAEMIKLFTKNSSPTSPGTTFTS